MRLLSIPLVAIAASSPAAARTNVAILNVLCAITATKDGKAAVTELERKFAPDQEKLSKDQEEIDELQKLLRDAAARAEDVRPLRARLDDRIRTHRRIQQDLQAKFEEERKRVLAELRAKLMILVEQLAKQKHFDVVLGDGSPESAVFWRSDRTDITAEVIRRYDLALRTK
jgi:Skp family chaperone for outer membrane proteins